MALYFVLDYSYFIIYMLCIYLSLLLESAGLTVVIKQISLQSSIITWANNNIFRSWL